MTLPTVPFRRAYNYSAFQALNPDAPLPAGRIETDFDNAAYALDQLRLGMGGQAATVAALAGKLAGAAVLTGQLSLLTPEIFGAVGDGVADDRAAIQAAFDAASGGGGAVLLRPVTYRIGGTLTLRSNLVVHGNKATIKLASAAAVSVLRSDGFAALIGTGAYAGVQNVTLRDLILDGNNWTAPFNAAARGAQQQVPANADLCNGLDFYGWRLTLENVLILNVRGHGIRSEWGQYGEPMGGMESAILNCAVDVCGRHGWWNMGPHDHHTAGLTVTDCGQEADDTYCGVKAEGFQSGRFFNFHAWHRSGSANRMRFNASSTGGNQFIGCHFEGGRAMFESAGAFGDIIAGSSFYNSFGAAGSSMVVNKGSALQIIACDFRTNTGTTTDVFAIQQGVAGTPGTGLYVNGCFAFGLGRGILNFVNDGGLSSVDMRGFAPVAGPTTWAGSKSYTTHVRWVQGGTVIDLAPPVQMEARTRAGLLVDGAQFYRGLHFRLTDPAAAKSSLAYSDGVNWRYVGDNSLVT